jgi:molybdopterin synthase catalytic subunit
MIRTEIVKTPLPAAYPQEKGSGREGAVVEFRGIVRETEDGRPIRGIEYECHEAMARHQLEQIAARVASAFGLIDLIVIHRIGEIRVGEASLYLRATAPHRGEAFAAAAEMIAQLKRDVPIWKHGIEA